MSVIPETRTVDRHRRVNIPAPIADGYADGVSFAAAVEDGDIRLTPSAEGSGSVMTEKNRVRLPADVIANYAADTEFAVIDGGDVIVLRPTENIDISV